MIHQYKLGDLCVVLDVCSGSVHAVDEVAYDMIAGFETQERETLVDALAEKYRDREDVTRPELEGRDLERPCTGYAHLAFSVGSREAVEQLTDRLRRAGYPVLSGPRTTGDGYYESCVAGVEGIPVEITI